MKHDPKKQVYGMERVKSRTLSDEELAFMKGVELPSKKKSDDTPVETDAASPVVMPVAETRPQVKPIQEDITFSDRPSPISDDTIVITDATNTVEIVFEISQPDKDGKAQKPIAFSVTIKNSSIDISEDGISILIRGDIDVRPPTLVPLYIIVNDREKFNVMYTGGKHRFGKFTNISFAKLDD